ncbi:MAG: ATP-binding cassette domain-containing protein [Flavobacteriia bacterium]|nr:ATP-binding cassette domain-containing protein [Flavobacteriia bacterium]
MSERILRALMQLFAIIAKVDEEDENNPGTISKINNSRKIVESFLKSELNTSLVKKYTNLYEDYILIHQGKDKNNIALKKRTSVNSVKVLRICYQINEELTQRQKVIVLFRIFEYIHSNEVITSQELDFVSTVSESFNISSNEFKLIKYIQKKDWSEKIDDKDILYISPNKSHFELAKNFQLEGLDNEIRILRIKSINTLFFRYFGQDELVMNGQIVSNDRTYILNNGSSIKTLKSKTVYYSDVITRFLEDNQTEKIIFSVENIEHQFKKGNTGLHKLSFTEESGKLVGIMGGSGTGKSTLLNIFNGNIHPTKGKITINGINVHHNKTELEGVIGYVSQDDLLIEELTVFQNLFFNTKLCFENLSDLSISKKVIEVLIAVGLQDVKDLKVGSVFEKTISGGQRKRLNIALELIREPSILFVDEPTSGLSSRDSENIMDLLKELALKGKLIFVVIHQPSSDIFKMFDRLLVLDQGGYPIFDGNPLDSIVYFKTHIHHVNAEDRECELCGNVNPEQIFNIIDAKVVDEYGNFTNHRKTIPKEWNELYTQYQHIVKNENTINNNNNKEKLQPLNPTKHANKLIQFIVFFQRDFLSKIGNKQYLLINTFVAPILAIILSLFVRYYKKTDSNSYYSFYQNENIPQFIFIGVIVALFLGLTVAAEEINKDKKILKREGFLNLSRSSYLASKISILFIISAIQSLFFVIIGNLVLEIKDIWISEWLILFSISCLANVMGLNISSAFNSAKVIYITIPLLIIPQLLLSGVIVKFDKLNPSLSKSTEVPWIGNLMASRWGYEALIVDQLKNNQFDNIFFELKKTKSEAAWKKNYWIPEMKNQLNLLKDKNIDFSSKKNALLLIKNELNKESYKWKNLISLINRIHFNSPQINEQKIDEIRNLLDILSNQYTSIFNNSNRKIDQIIQNIGNKKYQDLQNAHSNENISDIATNKHESDKIIIYNHELIQKEDPIYLNAHNYTFFKTPFYCPEKSFFGTIISTFWSNFIILWIMTILSTIVLYYDLIKKLISNINFLIKKPIK